MIKCLALNQLKMIPKNVKNHSNCASGITSDSIHLHGDVSPLGCDVYDRGIEVEFPFSYGSPHGQSHLKNPLMKVYENDVHH